MHGDYSERYCIIHMKVAKGVHLTCSRHRKGWWLRDVMEVLAKTNVLIILQNINVWITRVYTLLLYGVTLYLIKVEGNKIYCHKQRRCHVPVLFLSFPFLSLPILLLSDKTNPPKIPASQGTWDLEPQLSWHLMLNQCSTRALCLCHELGRANQSWIKLFHPELLTICVCEWPTVRVCGQLSIGPLRQVLGEQRGSVVTAALATCCASRTPGP